jgi:peroxiredoxin Q/BCP
VRDAFEELEGKKVTVFGMSTDKPETQRRFKDKNKLPYDLISDRGGEIAKKLGISVRGGIFTARRALLFKGGKLVWRDDKGATSTQGADVLKAIAAVEGR